LREVKDHGLVRYRCHVGHGFSAESLLSGSDEKLEETLWSALRAIEELIELRNRMLERAKGQHLDVLSSSLEREIAELQERAATLRAVLLTRPADMEIRKRSRKQKVNGRKAS
jgi:two-component system chemotaxis response regulator CheB